MNTIYTVTFMKQVHIFKSRVDLLLFVKECYNDYPNKVIKIKALVNNFRAEFSIRKNSEDKLSVMFLKITSPDYGSYNIDKYEEEYVEYKDTCIEIRSIDRNLKLVQSSVDLSKHVELIEDGSYENIVSINTGKKELTQPEYVVDVDKLFKNSTDVIHQVNIANRTVEVRINMVRNKLTGITCTYDEIPTIDVDATLLLEYKLVLEELFRHIKKFYYILLKDLRHLDGV